MGGGGGVKFVCWGHRPLVRVGENFQVHARLHGRQLIAFPLKFRGVMPFDVGF